MFIVTKEGIRRTQASSIFVLQFSFSLMHESGRAAKKNKKKTKKAGNSYHVHDVRWTRGGHWGGRK